MALMAPYISTPAARLLVRPRRKRVVDVSGVIVVANDVPGDVETPVEPTLEELGRMVGVNRNKLAIGFKHVFGMTVGAYHRERRLLLAYEMLKEPGMTIARAADEAGYRDAGSFSKAFKARFGVLPSGVRS